MNQAHLHLMLNHIPFLGAVFGLIVFGFGWAKKNNTLTTTGLIMLLVATVMIIPVYLTGDKATEIVQQSNCVEDIYISQHEKSAEIATLLMMVLGSLSLTALFLPSVTDSATIIKLFYTSIIVIGLLCIGYMGYTAYEGGKISHPELRG